MPKLCYLALVALACASAVRADDHYVDLDTGSDAAAGTVGAPWRTLTYAMSTVAPSSGHRVLVRGTANLASPGETFPIRVPAGVSLEAWDAQHGAVLDAEHLPCVEIVGPAHRGQSLRGYNRNLRFVGTPAIAVEVVGVAESVDLVVEGCSVWGELRMILAEVVGQMRTGSCALTVRSCGMNALTVECLTTSVSSAHDVLSVSLVESVASFVLLRGLSAPTRPLELLRNPDLYRVDIERCSAATAVLEDNNILSMNAEVRASTILCRRNYSDFGSLYVTAEGRLQVLQNRLLVGSLSIVGDRVEQVHDNVISDGVLSLGTLGALNAPCSVLRNYAWGLGVDAPGLHALTIADNRLRMGMVLRSLPHAAVEILRNSIELEYPDHGIWLTARSVGHLAGAPLVTIAENWISGKPFYGAGVRVDAALGALAIERNEIWCDTGILFSDGADVLASPSGEGFRIERNAISAFDLGADLGLAAAREDLRFLNNVIYGGDRGVAVRRGTYTGAIRFGNNIVSSSRSSTVSGAFAPSDRVTNNFCSDGSLLALHPTNLSGDPQFESYPQRLRATSPCVGSGMDPATGLPGFNMGLDPLQPSATLHYREQSETEATLRLEAPGSTGAILLFGVALGSAPHLSLCDGFSGVHLESGYFAIPLPVSNGSLSLPLALPPGPWTVVVQALSEVASALTLCRASNTVVVRR